MLTTLGRYEILAELGQGAMGIVYKARDPMIDRLVAIKTISLYLPKDELAEYEARFYQEARAAGRLNHPNIVTIHDVGKEGNVAYMAMEFLEGRELRDLVASGTPLPVAQAVDVAAQVAEGLAYAHDHQVVHRDIKPANIMIVRDGLVKITDFGIARMRQSEVKTMTGYVLGSPKYMSPEQITGKRADHRSDIFSLGIVLYEMLMGNAPFTGDSIHSIMYQTVNLVPEPPSRRNPAVPEMLDLIVAKAMAKDAEARYASTRELATDLRACKEQLAKGGAGAVAGPSAPPSDGARTLTTPAAVAWGAAPTAAAEEASPALALSKTFDSGGATLRLAQLTGSVDDLAAYAKTQKLPLPGAGPAPAAPNAGAGAAEAPMGTIVQDNPLVAPPATANPIWMWMAAAAVGLLVLVIVVSA
ncbi:MAG: serine/threonine protein kinase [Betaproteobacteria bacterium]|nr:serine/threonine protein kinase [Betaproteobacteria bacterium]